MMKGQMTITDWLADQAAERAARETGPVLIKECQNGSKWKSVTAGEALTWARDRYAALKGVAQSYRADYINDQLIRGIRFTDDELRR